VTDKRARRRERRIRWAARLGPFVLATLARTWRLTVLNAESWRARRRAGQPVLFAFWHAQMLPLLWQHRNEQVAVLISTHSDGEIVARICEALGFRTIRGSSTRGGARALVEMTRALQQGIDVAVTPDGPRGPAETVAPGVVYVAQRAAVPVTTIAVQASRAWRLRTWDRFMIPKPFARITIRYGGPEPIAPLDTEAAVASEAERLGRHLQALGGAGT
jgi:lysophospholipid acyltransferase (LPLAT)-like uncharacterized protein